jgi:hypothetical protein
LERYEYFEIENYPGLIVDYRAKEFAISYLKNNKCNKWLHPIRLKRDEIYSVLI